MYQPAAVGEKRFQATNPGGRHNALTGPPGKGSLFQLGGREADMAKARRSGEKSWLNALVSWWHTRRPGLRPDWWTSRAADEDTAMNLVKDVSVFWQDHGRQILKELEEERRALESSARRAYARTGEWLADVGSILAGRKWSGKSKRLSALANLFTFDNKPIGLARLLRENLEGDWEPAAVFYPDASLSDQNASADVDFAYNESLANALKRLRVIGLEPLYEAAKWLEERLPEALLNASQIGVVRKSPLQLPAAAVHKAVNALYESLGNLVYEAVLRHANGLTEGQRDDLHEALDWAVLAQLDYALHRQPEQLNELVHRQRASVWPYTVALPLVLSMHGTGMAHLKDVAGIQRSMAWLEGLDEAWRAWLSPAAPDSVVGKEPSLSGLWFKTAFALTGSARDRAVAAATATTFLLERISAAYAVADEAGGGTTTPGFPLHAPRLEDCHVKLELGEDKVVVKVVVAVSGQKGQSISVKRSIMRMLKGGMAGRIPRSSNPNAATNFRSWFREHFHVLDSDHSDPLKLNDDRKTYAVRFSLSLLDPYLSIGTAQFPGRVSAHLRAENQAAQRRSGKEESASVDRSIDAKERIRSHFQQEFGRPPTDDEVANLLEQAQDRNLLSE